MNPGGTKRKLAAILSADAVGYSRLMAGDEEATAQTLKAHRAAITALIGQHAGRVVDAVGDNLMAEFASVVDAVACAVDIQRELAGRNAELPRERRMPFRIGINLGDVIVEDDRIIGDGVNVAARVEGLAEPGGIAVSGTTFDHVAGKLALEFGDLGEQTVKNIPKPVRVYQVVAKTRDAASQWRPCGSTFPPLLLSAISKDGGKPAGRRSDGGRAPQRGPRSRSVIPRREFQACQRRAWIITLDFHEIAFSDLQHDSGRITTHSQDRQTESEDVMRTRSIAAILAAMFVLAPTLALAASTVVFQVRTDLKPGVEFTKIRT